MVRVDIDTLQKWVRTEVELIQLRSFLSFPLIFITIRFRPNQAGFQIAREEAGVWNDELYGCFNDLKLNYYIMKLVLDSARWFV